MSTTADTPTEAAQDKPRTTVTIEIDLVHDEGPQASLDAVRRALAAEVRAQVEAVFPPEGRVDDLDKPDATYLVTGVRTVDNQAKPAGLINCPTCGAVTLTTLVADRKCPACQRDADLA